ncbi:MAG: hypothetical protein JKY24_00605 [Pseudomonadales bacterium]|nr:hypothetical protein [Pseudomonadales bacterium]
MPNKKEFKLQRIRVFAGEDIDPFSDEQVVSTLLNKFDIRLPQRRTLNESLKATSSVHEIVDLILGYREEV